MPRTTSIHTGALEDLATQLRFAPAITILRQAAAIEALAIETRPESLYPEDFLVFKVTGYRTPIEEPAMIVGSALLSDLSALAERITSGGRLTLREHDDPGSASIDDLRERWGVSRKTIERYRRQGLVARRLRRDDGKEVLRFSVRTVEHFEHHHRSQLSSARTFERLNDSDANAIVERARMIALEPGATLTACAKRIAHEFARSTETIRQHLLTADPPVFPGHGTLTPRDAAELTRRHSLGTPVSELALRYSRSPASVRRISQQVRASRLPTLEHLAVNIEGAVDAIGLCPPELPALTASAFAESARSDPPTEALREQSLALAYHANRHACASLADRAKLTAEELDAAETFLRRSAYLKRALVRASRRLVLGAIEERAGGAFEQLDPEDARRAHRAGMAALARAIDYFDPTTGGRLAARASLDLSRALARLADLRSAETPRADAPLDDWTLTLIADQESVMPSYVVARIEALDQEAARDLLALRFGTLGGEPMTLAALAEHSGVSRLAIARQMNKMLRVL